MVRSTTQGLPTVSMNTPQWKELLLLKSAMNWSQQWDQTTKKIARILRRSTQPTLFFLSHSIWGKRAKIYKWLSAAGSAASHKNKSFAFFIKTAPSFIFTEE